MCRTAVSVAAPVSPTRGRPATRVAGACSRGRVRAARGVAIGVLWLLLAPAVARAEEAPKGRVLAQEPGSQWWRECASSQPCAPGAMRGVWWPDDVAMVLAREHKSYGEMTALTEAQDRKISLLEERLKLWVDMHGVAIKQAEAAETLAARTEVMIATANTRVVELERQRFRWFGFGMLATAVAVGVGLLVHAL